MATDHLVELRRKMAIIETEAEKQNARLLMRTK